MSIKCCAAYDEAEEAKDKEREKDMEIHANEEKNFDGFFSF